MKTLIYILTVLTLIGCFNSLNKEKIRDSIGVEAPITKGLPHSLADSNLRIEELKTVIDEPQHVEIGKCTETITDFFKLQNKVLQLDLFMKIDSIRKIQYPKHAQENSIMVDLTEEYLSRFLNDINTDSLIKNQVFEKEYHFNEAPEGFTDPVECKDRIEISFDQGNCSFRLNIYNTFFVEPNWCTESMVVYGFKLSNDKIIDFWRQEAG